MKKTIYLFFIMSLIMITVCSCQLKTNSKENEKITNIENRLSALESENAINKSKLNELLSGNANTESAASPSSSSSENSTEELSQSQPQKGFTYSVTNGYATITGYVGNEKSLVIPASIDGYKVISIGDHAFEDGMFNSVIISNGVESIGWFSFNGCVKLKDITVPPSVTSIGYSAFGNADSSTNIFCHSGSFVLEYAKSFGLSYTII